MMLADSPVGDLARLSRRFGTRTAIICQNQSLSFEDLDRETDRLARHFAAQGLRPGDVASLFAQAGLAWVLSYHAILKAGGAVNPINALLTASEVGYILNDCKSRMLIADTPRLEALTQNQAVPAFTRMLDISTLTDASEGVGLPLPAVAPDSLSTVCYTSGTTGRPKGAMLSHRNVMLNIGLTALMHARRPDDVVLTALPPAHVYGNVVINGAILSGATLVLLPAFSPEAVFTAMNDHGVTCFDGVPTMYYRLLQQAPAGGAAPAQLRQCTVGGQTMPVEMMQAAEKLFGCPLIELWGMSEIAGLGTTFPATGPRVLGSIGVPLPGMQVRIDGLETGLPAAPGQAGEMKIRGPLVMQGYLGNKAATEEVLDADGWLRTGDVAHMDEAGRVFILDRLKDLILTSGNNVYPAEIERVIAELPGINMVGVASAPHPEKGEIALAFIVRAPGATLNADQVLSHCRANLAPYKVPKEVRFVDSLPMTSSGKILRRMLTGRN